MYSIMYEMFQDFNDERLMMKLRLFMKSVLLFSVNKQTNIK